MQVKDFILKFGIKKLDGQPIESNGKIYKIVVDKDDTEFFSNLPKERIDSFINKGNYIFYAKDENDRCIWVYKTCNIINYKTFVFIDTITSETSTVHCQPYEIHNIFNTDFELAKWAEGRIIKREEYD